MDGTANPDEGAKPLRATMRVWTGRLYHALTDPEFIARYMGNTGPRSDFQVGSPVEWKSDPDGDFEDLGQHVLEAEPGRRLAYTWHPIQPMHRDLFDSDDAYRRLARSAPGSPSTSSRPTFPRWVSPAATGGFTSEPGAVLEHGLETDDP